MTLPRGVTTPGEPCTCRCHVQDGVKHIAACCGPPYETPDPREEPPRLPMATIYERPLDYPEHFVVRIWEVGAGNMRAGGVHLANTLEGARRMIPPQFDYRLPREAEDDPVIVETWI